MGAPHEDALLFCGKMYSSRSAGHFFRRAEYQSPRVGVFERRTKHQARRVGVVVTWKKCPTSRAGFPERGKKRQTRRVRLFLRRANCPTPREHDFFRVTKCRILRARSSACRSLTNSWTSAGPELRSPTPSNFTPHSPRHSRQSICIRTCGMERLPGSLVAPDFSGLFDYPLLKIRGHLLVARKAFFMDAATAGE